jgi:hypothetical protein
VKWEQPGEVGLRERAEAELLRLYLHCPTARGSIRAEVLDMETRIHALFDALNADTMSFLERLLQRAPLPEPAR